MEGYPIEIEKFHKSVLKLKGITSVESGIDNLEPVNTELLKLSNCAHLPHATLLRTSGGLEKEVLIQFEFLIDYSIESFNSVEFLAWFVRDNARGGTKIQLRPFALPPETPQGRQFGRTLKFQIDLFMDGIEDSLEPVLKEIDDLNKSLNLFVNLYKIPTKD